MTEAKFPPMMTVLSQNTEPYPFPEHVKCFHVQAGQPCTRYLEGSQGERKEIVAALRQLSHDLEEEGSEDYACGVERAIQLIVSLPTGSADK
jgi:histidinol-phosphate/aromatic aminotransferase/cobyric acid decarboxylase-like protein